MLFILACLLLFILQRVGVTMAYDASRVSSHGESRVVCDVVPPQPTQLVNRWPNDIGTIRTRSRFKILTTTPTTA